MPRGGKSERTSESAASIRRHDEPGQYEVRIKGRLDQRWAGRFDGLSLIHESDGTTTLAGPVADQAALHGVLRTVSDLGLPLISVRQIDPEQAPGPDAVRRTSRTRREQ
jgi:hypothetical protein